MSRLWQRETRGGELLPAWQLVEDLGSRGEGGDIVFAPSNVKYTTLLSCNTKQHVV